MLSREDNELICRVGPGTPMGEALRGYWLPALLSSDLPEASGDPKHVELLGEHLVAFRDSSGRAGLLAEGCCHRGASLTLGRVEDDGIRCIYHGWKFAVDGKVLETPNVADARFKERFRATSYPVVEAGGFIWTHLGPAQKRPPFPAWNWFAVPASHRVNSVHVVGCNWVQALEGLLDSSHLNILHSNGIRASTGAADLAYAEKLATLRFDTAPRFEMKLAEFGFRYAALRNSGEQGGARQARITCFVAPCSVANANGDVVTIVVPINDTQSNFYHVFWHAERRLGEEPWRSQQLQFVGLDAATLDASGLSARTFTSERQPSHANRFHQDRAAMRQGSFSGITGLIEEDIAVSVSAGPIRDRSKEQLSAADLAISGLYQVLLKCARSASSGGDPVGVAADISTAVGMQVLLSEGESWDAPALQVQTASPPSSALHVPS